MLKLDFWPLNGLDSRVAGKLLLAQMYEELTGEEMPPSRKPPRASPISPEAICTSPSPTPRPPFSVPSPTLRSALTPRI